MIIVFEMSSALKEVHSNDLVHKDLKPENIMVEEDGTIRLGDFGGTKDQASIQTDSNQTGVFTWGWADSNARIGKYSKECEVYAFGLNAYYILYAEPLFTRDDQNAYLQNQFNLDNDFGDEYFLQGTIKSCLLDDPSERPTFEFLEKDVF